MVGKFFKVIETKYHGYKFRSRLEARWAVFFDTIGIEYWYEHEGYSLEGTLYLPDFYLPQQDCFVEVKGEEPTKEEKRKASLLSLHTGKLVYIFFGNIGFPTDSKSHKIFLEHPPALFASKVGGYKELDFNLHISHQYYDSNEYPCDEYPEVDENAEPPEFKKIKTSCEVLSILQKLTSVYIFPKIYPGSDILFLDLYQQSPCYRLHKIEYLINVIQEQHDMLVSIAPLIKKYEKDLAVALTVENGWQVYFQEQRFEANLEWLECKNCHEIILRFNTGYHDDCRNSIPSELVNNSQRLVAAYTAARQARF